MKQAPYDQRYAGDEYYWGKEPSSMAPRVVELMEPSADFHPKLLDLGCGEGRDVVYFAQHGFEAIGLDLSLIGLEKGQRCAEEIGVRIETIHAAIADYELEGIYDVVFSTGALHYPPPDKREGRFENHKAHTSPDGTNVISLFVEKPFIPPAPDADAKAYPFKSGELTGYYWDWETAHYHHRKSSTARPAVSRTDMRSAA
jgi:tellurite methyltransferase